MPAPILLLIDLQAAIDHPDWGERNNPLAEANQTALLAHWRGKGWPVWHVRHDSTEAHSHYRPGQPFHAFRAPTVPLPGERVIAKRVNSAFIGTPLADELVSAGSPPLFVCGVLTNNSVEATVRMAGNLGFDCRLIQDACFTFAMRDYGGNWRSADEVHAMSLANLAGEYCQVVTAAEAIAAF